MIKNIASLLLFVPILVLSMKDKVALEVGQREENIAFRYIIEEENEIIDGFLYFPNEVNVSDLYL